MKRYLFFSLICYLISILFVVNTAFAVEKPVTYGSDVTITGLVYVEYFYEEINYGESPETDHIAGACLLKLDSPLPFKDKKIGTLHLIFTNPKTRNCTQLIGHRIKVTGTFDEAITGHQHGDAILLVKEEKILR